MDVILPENVNLTLHQLITYYVNLRPKFSYKDICVILNEHHGETVTVRQIKHFCKKNGWNRKRNVDDQTLEELVINELGMFNILFYLL